MCVRTSASTLPGLGSAGEPVPVRGAGDSCRDLRGYFANSRQRGVKAALRQIGRGDELREGARRVHEHFVDDLPRAADDRARAYAWEDAGVVALPREIGLAVQLHRVEGAAAGEQRTPPGPAIRLLGVALGL